MMQSGENRDGLPPEKQWTEREESVERGGLPFPDAPAADPRRKQVLLRVELEAMSEQVAHLRRKVEALKSPVVALDRSAHRQLGSYPWAKLMVAALTTYTIARNSWFLAIVLGFGALFGTRTPSRF